MRSPSWLEFGRHNIEEEVTTQKATPKKFEGLPSIICWSEALFIFERRVPRARERTTRIGNAKKFLKFTQGPGECSFLSTGVERP